MKDPAVYLIGAGPGDPGLITVHGLACLQKADVVIHDRLVPRRILQQARAGAELIDVGFPSPNTTAQEAIGYLVAEKAREDKIVARLKWGDAFALGRGAEEAWQLRQAGVPFEVVPGVPPAVGAPAYAGVPLFFPGLGDTVTLVRGLDNEGIEAPAIDWTSLVTLGGTVVVHNAAPQLARVLEAMIAAGWPADGPALVVSNGTLPKQDTAAGTVAEVLESVRHQPRRQAALLVAGRVAGLRERLRWFDTRPLFGRTVLVTRPREQARELVERLAARGAETIEAPLIRIEPPEDPAPLLRAAAAADRFDWIVFTSANAVEAFMTALLDGERDVRALHGPRLCAVGSATAARLAGYGIRVDLVPDDFHAEGVLQALARTGPLEGARVLLPRADIGREIIAEQLRKEGAEVTDVIAYRTVIEDAPRAGEPDVYRLLLDGRIDVVTFTSPSAVRNFARVYGADEAADLLKSTVVATIGPVTADAAAQLGIAVAVQPDSYTVPALVEALAAYFARRGDGG